MFTEVLILLFLIKKKNHALLLLKWTVIYVFTICFCLKVPANIPPDSGKSSGNEESDVDTNSADGAHSRRVRFKQLVIKY